MRKIRTFFLLLLSAVCISREWLILLTVFSIIFQYCFTKPFRRRFCADFFCPLPLPSFHRLLCPLPLLSLFRFLIRLHSWPKSDLCSVAHLLRRRQRSDFFKAPLFLTLFARSPPFFFVLKRLLALPRKIGAASLLYLISPDFYPFKFIGFFAVLTGKISCKRAPLERSKIFPRKNYLKQTGFAKRLLFFSALLPLF